MEQLQKEYEIALKEYNDARNAKPRNVILIRVKGEAARKAAKAIIDSK